MTMQKTAFRNHEKQFIVKERLYNKKHDKRDDGADIGNKLRTSKEVYII